MSPATSTVPTSAATSFSVSRQSHKRLRISQIYNTNCYSTVSRTPHHCCHLLNKVENVECMPDIPDSFKLQLAGRHLLKLSLPMGRSGSCHLLNKVENVECMPDIPDSFKLQLAGRHPLKLSLPMGRSGSSPDPLFLPKCMP